MSNENKSTLERKEIFITNKNGMGMLLLTTLIFFGSISFGVINSFGIYRMPSYVYAIIVAVFFVIIPICCLINFGGLKVIKPNEALVLTLFGNYYGSIKTEGFYYVNPFASAFNPTAESDSQASSATISVNTQTAQPRRINKRMSLKTLTLNNDKQKINDLLGNPVIISIVVIWKVIDTTKAAFNVDNYIEYLSIQCDSALRNIVRMYPYDAEDNEKSLRGSSQEISEKIKQELQEKVELAGLEIIEARITHLSYAQEIAAAMLQRQQASAIIDARQMIVEGAVGMVDMALRQLSENKIVDLDDERKAAMVSNLLVVLCGNKDAQPIVNSGSLY